MLAILSQVGDILEDGLISLDELRNMQARIEQIISDKGSETPESVGHIEELVVFLAGTTGERDCAASSNHTRRRNHHR